MQKKKWSESSLSEKIVGSVMTAIILGVPVFLFSKCMSSCSESAAEDKAEAEAKKKQELILLAEINDDKCLDTPECRVKKIDYICNNKPINVGDCTIAIQNQANYDYEWDGFLNSVAANAKCTVNLNSQRNPEQHHVLALQGNNLKLQNGFGAWKRVTYRCEYNLETNELTSAKIYE